MEKAGVDIKTKSAELNDIKIEMQSVKDETEDLNSRLEKL